MPSRRRVLADVVPGGAAGSAAFDPDGLGQGPEAWQAVAGRSPDDVGRDESCWREIQIACTLDRTVINLNIDGVCPRPPVVHEAFTRYADIRNLSPVCHRRHILGDVAQRGKV